MANTKKPEEGLVINNPQFNGANELISFDGIKLLGNKNLDETDADSMALVKKVKELERVKPYTGSAAPRVKVGEKEYALSYKFYTDEEKTTYKTYRDSHSSGSSAPKKVVNESADRAFDWLTDFINKYKDKTNEDIKAAVSEARQFRGTFVSDISTEKKEALFQEWATQM